MKLSDKAVADFKKIYFETYKIRLSEGEANKRALNLLKLMKLVYKPILVNIQMQRI